MGGAGPEERLVFVLFFLADECTAHGIDTTFFFLLGRLNYEWAHDGNGSYTGASERDHG
jgi:hypothetical protein